MFTSGDIYESKYNVTKWSKCKKLNAAVNTGYSESFASYSPDGKTLYFTSNRLGGLGGYDIYKASARENGDWSEAVNLGPTVNTPFDEATPSVSPDGKFLFFSSKGHSSIGGFDIFRSSILDGKYLYARNMGYPINTSSDNINWISTENEQTGYMPAILPQGAGGFDIWKFQSYSIPDIPRFIIYGNTVISDLSDSTRIPVNICLENTESKIRECQENLIPDKKGFRFKSLSGKYELTVTAKGFITQNKRILLDPEQVESDIHIDFTLTQIPAIAKARTIEIRSLFFSFNSVKIKEEFFGMLDTLAGLLKEFPELVLKVSGNTDGLGGKAVNQRFSINRARAVSNYLSSKGIDSARIECMAAGSMKPIALEKSDHGRDIPEGRALNRRVELTLSPTDKVRIHCINPSVPAELRIDK